MKLKLGELAVNVGIALFSVIVCLLLLEVVLRVADPKFLHGGVADVCGNGTDYLHYDESLGWRYAPDKCVLYLNSQQDYFVYTNSKGFRDSEWAAPNGKRRVVFLGDSFTAGLYVEENESYVGLLKRAWANEFDVANLGTEGYGTDQEALLFESDGRAYKPDYVVVGFLIGNDFDDNSEAVSVASTKPYFVLSNGSLELRGVPAVKPWQGRLRLWAYQNSYVFRIFNNVYDRSPAVKTFISSAAHFRFGELFKPAAKYLPNEWKYYLQNESPDARKNLELAKAILRRIFADARAAGAEPVLVIIPSRNQADHSAVQAFSAAFAINESQLDMEKPNRELAALAQAENVTVIDLLPLMCESIKNGKTLYLEDGHWNQEGHLLAFEYLDGILRRKFNE